MIIITSMDPVSVCLYHLELACHTQLIHTARPVSGKFRFAFASRHLGKLAEPNGSFGGLVSGKAWQGALGETS